MNGCDLLSGCDRFLDTHKPKRGLVSRAKMLALVICRSKILTKLWVAIRELFYLARWVCAVNTKFMGSSLVDKALVVK